MYDFKKTESEITNFWQDHQTFEKSLELRRKAKRFVWWEGPPTANGLPHIGHFLTRVYKDFYGRYKTMRGFFVLRKAGWDTHGLPVEIEIEKELGFKNKKEIDEYGIAKFNRKARESVWKYTHEWEEMTKRLGFWLDLKHPYVTYHTEYMESVWNILKQIWDRGLLYQAHKVVPFCTRCGTPLSAHEVAQGYKKVTERSVYIKFKVVSQPNTYILAWTTTPWTLPGNVALAVGADIRYVYAKHDSQTFILAKDLVEKVLGGASVEKEVSGSELVGLEYEPLFDVEELKSDKSYKVYPADFVSTVDGTGVVHTAVMYGEEDYNLGTKLELPKFHTVDEQGKFVKAAGDDLAGKYVKAKETEDFIIKKLEDKNLLLKIEDYEHDYPFCWRCGTPLLYYAKTSWFIKTSAINKELMEANAGVNWVPEHIRAGRFGQWLREGKDWTLSRERYWGTPLPIWQCGQCNERVTIGSVKELEKLSIGSRNTYYIMRHGATNRNEAVEKIVNSRLESDHYHLTEDGKVQVERSLELMKLEGIHHIYTSSFNRTKETAEIAARTLHQEFETDDRLREVEHSPDAEGKSEKKHAGAEVIVESQESIRGRLAEFMAEMESTYRGKKILIVTHGAPAYFLQAIAHGYSVEELKETPERFPYFIPDLAEIKKLDWRKIPRNEYGELDLHRPFVDDVVLKCAKCKSKMNKIPDLIDVWFDSGAMPYAQWHYPFENKAQFKNQFPADFIVEAIDQTRGWFWSLLGISGSLGLGVPYKNVMVLGHVLDEKGQKMSKSKKNYVPVMELMDTYGADLLRWYFLSTMTAGESKSFIPKEVDSKLKGFIFTLQNTVHFYELYKESAPSEAAKLSLLDKWLLSRLNRLIMETFENLDAYEVAATGRAIEQFVIEDLSNWWVRRSRKRKESLPVLRLVLLDVARLLAPFTPFMAEDMYHRLQGNRQFSISNSQFPMNEPESIHLNDWPKVVKKYLDEKLEAEMVSARDFIARGLAVRKDKQLKVRQPLASVSLKRDKKFKPELETLVKDELNAKKVKYDKNQTDDLIYDLELTSALRAEGYAREAMRQIQDMRKEAKYRMDDLVVAHWHSDDADIAAAMEQWSEDIKKDTMLKSFERHPKSSGFDIEKESDLAPLAGQAGKQIWIGIKK